MSLLVRYHLFRMARRVQPSREFLLGLENRLFSKPEVNHLHVLHFMRIAVVPALLLISLLMGTGTYAYASDQVLPDHFLYPMRQSVEGFEIQLASVAGMKDRVRLRQLERRAREKALLKERALHKKPEKSKPAHPPAGGKTLKKSAPKPAKAGSI